MDKIVLIAAEVGPTRRLRGRAAFWIPRSANTPTWYQPPAASEVPNASEDELAAIRSGAIVERVVVSEWTNNPEDIAELGNILVAAYQVEAQAVASEQALADAAGGYRHDGVSWRQTEKPIPEQRRTSVNAQSARARVLSGTPADSDSIQQILRSIEEKLELLVSIASE